MQLNANPDGRKIYYKIDNINFKISDEIFWNDPKYFKIEDEYLDGWIDEFSIASWNNTYCYKFKNATKEEVKKEFIEPKFLKIKPFDWEKQLKIEKQNRDENNWLTFNMNLLGNSMLKKQLGAFFTPDKYVKIATKMIREAIKKVPKGNEYIILDRCAGTGNLEKFLSAEELEHCVINTYDYTEWTTLKGLYEGRVKMIIPPTNKYRDENGLLKNGDALSESFVNYEPLIQLINDPKITVIMLENPPYRNITDNTKGKSLDKKDQSFLLKEMKEDKTVESFAKNDLINIFIWSACKYYLTKPNDSYIIFAPIKYWKSHHLMGYFKYEKGFLMNRKNFNATESAISLIHWSKVDYDEKREKLDFSIADSIAYEEKFIYEVKRVYKRPSTLFGNKKNDKNPIAIMNISGYNLDVSAVGLYTKKEDLRGNGSPTLLYGDDFINYLPLFAAKNYRNKNWWEKETIFTTGDGGKKYIDDRAFLKSCLLWTCISAKNKCFSNDEKQNQIALTLKTDLVTAADLFYKIFRDEKLINFDDMQLIDAWSEILSESSQKAEFNKTYVYGLYQIEKQINVKYETEGYTKTGTHILNVKYQKLDLKIKKIKKILNDYYEKHIEKKLFKYELLK